MVFMFSDVFMWVDLMENTRDWYNENLGFVSPSQPIGRADWLAPSQPILFQLGMPKMLSFWPFHLKALTHWKPDLQIWIDTIDTIDTDFPWINLFWENYVKWMMPPWKEIMFLPVEETAMAMICSPTQLDDQREISYYS